MRRNNEIRREREEREKERRRRQEERERERAAAEGGAVIACSALKRIYRDHIAKGCLTPPIFIHLHAPRHVIDGRLAARANHFFDESLLDSQMDSLEMPSHDEIYRLIDAKADIDSVYEAICKALS